MAVQLYTNALTTQTRMKDRLAITVTTFDALFISLINSATDWIEGECNRKFLRQTYTQQVYSVRNSGMQMLALENIPVSNLAACEYRAGTPSAPNWTAFIPDEFELVEDGKSGLVRIYQSLPFGINSVRATYTAGFLFDFANYGSATHTLPADLTELCERIVTKAFKQRDNKGKTSESFSGATVTWARDLDEDEKSILARYRRLPAFA